MDIKTLIILLENYDQNKEVRFDFPGYCAPNGFNSYRGYYEQLAIGYERTNPTCLNTVGKFLEGLKETIGKTFTGYKGGGNIMDQDTEIWVSNYGDASGVTVTRVIEKGYVYLITKMID